MTRCKTCGAAVIWCATTKGKAMPVDAAATADGNLRLIRDASGAITAHVVAMPPDPSDTGPRHVSHFSTCPNAGQHRRTR